MRWIGLMHRQEFISALAGGTLAAPLSVQGQQAGKVPQVGYLNPGSVTDPLRQRRFELFRQSLRDLGYVDGHRVPLGRGAV